MNTVSNLLTVAEAATDQIEIAYESGHGQANDLEDKVVIALDLLNSIEDMLMEKSSQASNDMEWPSQADVARLFGT